MFIGYAKASPLTSKQARQIPPRPGGKVSKEYRAIGLYREVGKGVPVASYT